MALFENGKTKMTYANHFKSNETMVTYRDSGETEVLSLFILNNFIRSLTVYFSLQ
jgi:hypothetical protein